MVYARTKSLGLVVGRLQGAWGPSEAESEFCQYEYIYISRDAMSQKLSTCILILLIEMA